MPLRSPMTTRRTRVSIAMRAFVMLATCAGVNAQPQAAGSPAPAESSMGAVAVLLGVLVVFGLVLRWNRTLRTQIAARTTKLVELVSEKEKLAHSLGEREQRLRMMVEQMPAFLWSTDANLIVTSASGLGLKTLGLDADRLVGATTQSIIDELGLEKTPVTERLKAGLQGHASDVEIQIGGRDAEVHIEPMRDASGAITGLVGIVQDVADRRRAARALQESEERYRAFVERSAEGIWRWEMTQPWPKGATVDAQFDHFNDYGYVAECNDAMARLYGLTHARELVGKTFRQVRALRQSVSGANPIRAFIAAGFPASQWQTNWIDRGGASRWSASTIVGIVEDGALVRAWSTQRDITEQRLAEEGMKHAFSLLKATLESTADGILVFDSGGRIVDFNERFLEMWSVPADLMSAGGLQRAPLAVHAMKQLQDASGFAERVQEILAQPDGESHDLVRLKDGRVLERYSRPQRAGDTVVGRVWSFRDITERERALRDIQEANRLLEIKNGELERFTYTVSHDLRSPLITIRGYLGHLEASAVEGNMERFREDAGRITRAASKMEDLLRDLLELSRIGRVVRPDADVPFAAVVQDAVDLMRGPLREQDVQLEVDSDLPVVRGDRQRLVEVIQNLIENAIKFRGESSQPKIRVGARTDGTERVVFVQDNGIGLEPRHRERIFELFEKLSSGSAGTGVGLALVKRIVEAHGGRIWVESTGLGQGSTFCFTVRTTTT